MEQIFSILSDFWGLIFGTGGIIATFVFWRQNVTLKNAEARQKNAEAGSVEIDNLKKAIDILKQRIDDLHEELKETREQLAQVRLDNTTLYKDKSLLELKNSQKKSCINTANECGCKPKNGCPVLNRQKELEDNYLEMLKERETIKSKQNGTDNKELYAE